jgi:hypothetical protein
MELNEFTQLPLWQRMVAASGKQETAMVEKHVGYIVPLMEHYADTFPTYTLHNRQHIYNVIKIMGQLMGDRIGDLRGLEAIILVLSAAYHDYGMIYSENERERISTYESFNLEFLVQNPGAKLLFEQNDKIVSEELAEWYCRWAHAVRVWPKLEQMEHKFGNLLWEGMPIRENLGHVCESHNEPAERIRIDDRRFKSEFWGICDLKFCALLLRLADILDFDNSRSPQSVYDYLDLGNPENRSEKISRDEWHKHMASRGFYFHEKPDAEPIKFKAAPSHPYIEQAIRNFLNLIDLELAAAGKVTELCSPRWRNFSFPESVNREDIVSENYVTGKYRFSLSEDKILDLLTGDDLYNDDFVFVRELLQNAIDTVRHRSFIERINSSDFRPIAIEISFFKDPEGYYWLRIDDAGMGMDQNIIKSYLLNKGNSYYNSDEFKLEKITIKSKQHEDFVPISRFGIGLLSCFMTCDKIEISTCYFYAPPGQPRDKTRLSIEGRAGYWVIRSDKMHHVADRMPSENGWQNGYRQTVGTSIACRIKTSREFSGLNMESEIERFLLAPEIPIIFRGKSMGGDRNSMVMQPWCKHEKGFLPEPFLRQCSELLKQEVQSIIIEVRPIDLTKMAASPNLTGQLVVLIPRIAVKNTLAHFSTADHFLFDTDSDKTFFVCEKVEKNADGRDITIDVRYDISEIISSINFPKKFLENRASYKFISPRVSHNGVVVYDNEHQLQFILPPFDQYDEYYDRHTRFYLSTGLFCFKDVLLPDLTVSRSTIKRFTIEMIAHVLYATREMNEYRASDNYLFSYLNDLERRRGPAEKFTIERLEKTGIYEKDKNYWHSLPCIATKTEVITIETAIGSATKGSLTFRTIPFQSAFFTEFVKYIVVKNFHVRYISDEDGYFLEGRLRNGNSPSHAEVRLFEPMQFLDSDNAVKIVLTNRSLNLQHPLIKWYLKNVNLIQKEFSYYGMQLINGLLGENSDAEKIQNVNEILGRLRSILPEHARPALELNVTEHQV